MTNECAINWKERAEKAEAELVALREDKARLNLEEGAGQMTPSADKEWLKRKATQEDGCYVSVGTETMKTPQEIAANYWDGEGVGSAGIRSRIAAAVQAERDRADKERERADANWESYERVKVSLSDKHNELKEARATVKRLRKALMDEICPEGGCNHQDCLDCWKFLRDTDPEAHGGEIMNSLSKLAKALKEHLQVSGLILSNDPMDEVTIPLKGGGKLTIPTVLLSEDESSHT